MAKGVNEGVQLIVGRLSDPMEALFSVAVFDVSPIEKQYVVIYIQIQRGTKALDESYRSTLCRCLGKRFLNQIGSECAVNDAQDLAHQLRVTGQQKAQLERKAQHPLA